MKVELPTLRWTLKRRERTIHYRVQTGTIIVRNDSAPSGTDFNLGAPPRRMQVQEGTHGILGFKSDFVARY